MGPDFYLACGKGTGRNLGKRKEGENTMSMSELERLKKEHLMDGLFGISGEKQSESVTLKEIPLEQLHSALQNHFWVEHDDAMEELTASVREKGILEPFLVREKEGGGYEILSGHRRRHAAMDEVLQAMKPDRAIQKQIKPRAGVRVNKKLQKWVFPPNYDEEQIQQVILGLLDGRRNIIRIITVNEETDRNNRKRVALPGREAKQVAWMRSMILTIL